LQAHFRQNEYSWRSFGPRLAFHLPDPGSTLGIVPARAVIFA
jgi:hypothetical protein